MAKLAAYRAKRDFGATSEPSGQDGPAGGSAFVIQKHDASRLHYDLRLELDGVMKSWAVAKGPSLVPGEKRLAVHTEDHPVDYNTFEGTIPKGQYGGGTVLVWDRGTWIPQADPHRGYAKGHLDFRLEGEKLAGAWHLVRMARRPREKQEAWLLIKSDDEAARQAGDPDVLDEQPLSVVTGRNLEEVASAADGAVWNSDREPAGVKRTEKGRTKPPHPEVRGRKPSLEGRTDGAASRPSRPAARAPQDEEGRGTPAPMPKSIEPALATLVATVPSGPLWWHEIKWDGYRLLAFKARDTVRLATRRGHDWTLRFPAIAAAVAALPVESVVLDGEAVIEGEGGVADFSALQAALSDEGGRVARAALLYAFDLLYLDGIDLRGLPLEDRKRRLAALIPAGSGGDLRLGEHVEADGRTMMRSATELGLEGIVSKRRDRPYRSGRTDDWVKMKCVDRQEFVVVGFMPSAASRRAIGSLVLAYHDDGKFRLVGRAGTGYSGEAARALFKALEPTRVVSAPVDRRPTAEERRGVVWVKPTLVAEIEFRGWTGDENLRHAAYKGLREDKAVEEVVRERPAGQPASSEAASSEAAPVKPAPAKPAAKPARPRNGTAAVAGVALTHPDRVLWEEAGLTKQDLAEFYVGIAEWLLPQVAGRPLSLVRCPSGAEHGCFFQKHAWAGLGDAILRGTVRDGGAEEEILHVRDVAGIVSLVQASVLEIHPWGASVDDVERADRITMDLDPGEGVPFTDVIAGALAVRERLAAQGLESFVKTTGGKGLHVVVPLTGPAAWPVVKAFCKGIADGMAADSPDRYLAVASKSARRGLIYVDYLRNGRGATAIAAYSTRARPGAPVSVPMRWEELVPALVPNALTLTSLPARLRRLKADPWADLTRVQQGLPAGTSPVRRRKARSPG